MGSKFIESGNCGVLGGQGELDGGTLAPLDHLGHVGACPMKPGSPVGLFGIADYMQHEWRAGWQRAVQGALRAHT